MGQREGEKDRESSCSECSTTSKFDTIAAKCACNSAAAVAAAAGYTAAIFTFTTATITNFGAGTNSAAAAAAAAAARQTRWAVKNLGQCIVKRGWWSRFALFPFLLWFFFSL